MPVYKLHRILFFGQLATIELLVVLLIYTTARMNRLENAVQSADVTTLDVLEMQKRAAGRPSLDQAGEQMIHGWAGR